MDLQTKEKVQEIGKYLKNILPCQTKPFTSAFLKEKVLIVKINSDRYYCDLRNESVDKAYKLISWTFKDFVN